MKAKDSIAIIRINEDLKTRAEELADKKGMSLSAFVRFLLIQEIEKHEAQGYNLLEEAQAGYQRKKRGKKSE